MITPLLKENVVDLKCYSDLLCIWAYIGQIRLDEAKTQFQGKLKIHYHYITLFGDTKTRIGEGWSKKGGFDGFARYAHKVAVDFPHIHLHPDIWLKCRPASSAPAHLFLKATKLYLQSSDNKVESISIDVLMNSVRQAFFEQARNIGKLSVLMNIADNLKLPVDNIKKYIESGEAYALLCRDMSQKEALSLEGSPTYILNKGRQKLYGNVGYKILEANIQELIKEPDLDRASWC